MSTESCSSAQSEGNSTRLEAEHQLALVFNSARDMMLLARVEAGVLFRVISVNRTYLETVRSAGFDFAAADFEGRTFDEVSAMFGFGVAATALTRSRYEQALATGRTLEYEEVTLTPSGKFYGRSTITPIPDEAGRSAFLLYSSQDVTERVLAQQALKESEEKFAKAFLASPDAISVHELESGRCVDVNLGYLRLFGLTREQLIGHTPAELGIWLDPAERAAFVELLRREGAVKHFKAQVRLEGGRRGLCELSAERIELGGRPHNVTVLRDITAAAQAEQALCESEEKFAKAFRSSPAPLTITEIATGRYIEVNLGFERVTGFRREEVIGRTSLEIGIWENPADRDEMLRHLQSGSAVRDVEFRFRGRDGRPLVMRCSFEHIELAGRACLLTVLEDITEQRRTEQALRESEERVASTPSPSRNTRWSSRRSSPTSSRISSRAGAWPRCCTTPRNM